MSSKKKKYKSSFQVEWLSKPQYSSWIERDVGNDGLARCKICDKSFSVEAMGLKALDSHANGVKHKSKLPTNSSANTITSLIKKSQCSSGASSKPVVTEDSKQMKQSSITDVMTSAATLKAEIIWCLDLVYSRSSFRSSDHKSDQFATMFPDSKIAKEFSCARTKSMYFVTHGLAPFFKKLLVDAVKELDHYVLLFDESFNKIVNKGQMDLHIRFWNSLENQVCTRYFNSVFLGKARALDIYQKFKECKENLPDESVLQTSTDGPNVIKSFLKMYDEERKN